MNPSFQSRLDALTADFTSAILGAVLRASIDEVVAASRAGDPSAARPRSAPGPTPGPTRGLRALEERLQVAIAAWAVTYRLSRAHVDILQRSARGETREEIAKARGGRVPTVKKHIANMLQLMGENSFFVVVLRLLREVAAG